MKNIISNLISAIISPLIGLGYRSKLASFDLGVPKNTNAVWVVEAEESFLFFTRLYFYLKANLTLGASPKVYIFNTRLRYETRRTLKTRLMDTVTLNRWTQLRWRWIYTGMYPGEWLSFIDFKAKKQDHEEAIRIFESLKTKEELEALTYQDLVIGDLVYDTYLRFKPAATVNLKDSFLIELLEKAIAIVREHRAFFDQHPIDRVVVTYSSYLPHGLLLRVANERRIPIHALGVYTQLLSKPHPGFPYHDRHFFHYKKWFHALSNPEEARAMGKSILETRFSGKSGGSMNYMKSNPYARADGTFLSGPRLDARPKVVIMGHDFFDSPHCYGPMLYPDFYEWLNHVFSWAKESPYQFLYKPHPNALPDNEAINEVFRERYPEVVFVPKTVSNLEISKLPIQYVMTVYGSVAHEFSALGFKVLCCGENIHSSFSFTHRVESREELERLLLGKTPLEFKIDANEIYEFMYVHNYRFLRKEMDGFPWDVELPDAVSMLSDPVNRTETMVRAIQEIDTI